MIGLEFDNFLNQTWQSWFQNICNRITTDIDLLRLYGGKYLIIGLVFNENESDNLDAKSCQNCAAMFTYPILSLAYVS